MTHFDPSMVDAVFVEQERNILTRVAEGGPLDEVLRDLILLVEKPSQGEMMASILFLSADGNRLLEGAAPSLPAHYNKAIDGIAIGPSVGSCGTAAFTGEPTFVTDIATDPLWADFREIALENDLRACWSMPIRATDGRVLGTFANYYREPRQPTERDIGVIEMVAQTAAIAIERHQRDLERARLDEQRDLLLRELNHRVKNVFALANSLLVMSARAASNPQELVRSVQGRLQALSRAHELVQPGLTGMSLHHGSDIALDRVVRDILAPYAIVNMQERVRLAGPDLRVSAKAVTPVALVIHELATNAAKYGALSVSQGTVDVTWALSGKFLNLSWVESGGPKPVKPERTSFGTMLMRRSVESQLGGTIGYEWRDTGLAASIALPSGTITSAP